MEKKLISGIDVIEYQKKHVARRFGDLALNMRSIAYALEAIGEEEKARELRVSANTVGY